MLLWAQTSKDDAGTQLMVKFKPGVTAEARATLHRELKTVFLRRLRGMEEVEVVRLAPGAVADSVIAAYEKSGIVEYAEVDGVARALTPPPNQ